LLDIQNLDVNFLKKERKVVISGFVVDNEITEQKQRVGLKKSFWLLSSDL